MLNKVTLIGNLGQDPELKTTVNGNRVCALSVATTKKWTSKMGDKKEQTEWHKVECWDKTADIASEYGSKGDKLYLEGELKTDKWQDKEGQDRYTTKIIASRILYLGAKNSSTKNEQSSNKPNTSFVVDEIPF